MSISPWFVIDKPEYALSENASVGFINLIVRTESNLVVCVLDCLRVDSVYGNCPCTGYLMVRTFSRIEYFFHWYKSPLIVTLYSLVRYIISFSQRGTNSQFVVASV